MLSITTTEPRFTPDEKATLLASRRADRAPRGPHGLLLSEATDPANENNFDVPLPIMDFAERKLKAVKAAYSRNYPNTDMDVLHWRVEKKS